VIFSSTAGPLVLPGRYRVSLAKRVDGAVTPLADPQEFAVVVDESVNPYNGDLKALRAFQRRVARLARAVSGTVEAADEVGRRLEQLKRALDQTPAAKAEWKAQVRDLERRNRDIQRALRGDVVLRGRSENTPVAIAERVQSIVEAQRFSLAPPTATDRASYRIADEEFVQELGKLRTLVEVDLRKLEKEAEAAGAPWTPGRLPEWKDR
jgi:hypothetical protein